MQGPMPSRVLHDQKRRLSIRHMIMASLSGAVTNRYLPVELIALKERLAKPRDIALSSQPDAELLSNRTSRAIAADQIGRTDRHCVAACLDRGHDGTVILNKRQELAAVAHSDGR